MDIFGDGDSQGLFLLDAKHVLCLDLVSMYHVNKDKKSLEPIKKTAFKQVGIKERGDLQEWLVHNPEVFGEDLLVIQKEFAGFSETKERFDMLALDQQGNLVIIENKLDDSGRDVVWQALKYASYCASLTNQQIKDIFKQYLRDSNRNENVDEVFMDFFGNEDYEDQLNKGNTQRIILVSGEFRREVTSTVLWLSKYGIRTQCFKASVYSFKDELIFNLEQIIPMKDIGDYEIRMADKNLEEVTNQEELKNRHIKRIEFWTQFLEAMNEEGEIAENLTPGKENWMGLSIGMSGVNLNVVISQRYARAEIYINRGAKTENKRVFDLLIQNKEEIEKNFGDKLIWERMDDNVTSRIKYQLDNVDAFDSADWIKINNFLVDAVLRFEKTFTSEIKRIKTEI